MTCCIVYKDKDNHVWMASDRCSTLPLNWFNHKTKDVHYRLSNPKSAYKNGILIVGAGDTGTINRITSSDVIFPKPYLKNGTYREYIQEEFLPTILMDIQKVVDSKHGIFNINSICNFIFSIEGNIFYLDLHLFMFAKNENPLNDSLYCDDTTNIKMFNRYCAVIECKDDIILGAGSGFYYIKHFLYTTIDIMRSDETDNRIERYLRNACKDAAEYTPSCDKEIDIINDIH